MMNTKKIYAAPLFEVVEVGVEQGFAVTGVDVSSDGLGNGGYLSPSDTEDGN